MTGVQTCALPIWFPSHDSIVTEETNGYKYYYGAGSTKEACKKLVAEAKAKGYTSAFIVEDK